MENKLGRYLAACAALGYGLLCGPSVSAINVTVADGVTSGTGWWGTGGSGAGQENNETEPLTVSDQSWDLEAFVYQPATRKLTIIGGFPLTTANEGFRLGDVFIDSGSDHPVGAAAAAFTPDGGGLLYNKDFKYEFVVHFRRDGSDAIVGYDIYRLNQNSSNAGKGSALSPGYYSVLYASNPYGFVPTDEPVIATGSLLGGQMTYQTGLADSGLGANAVDTLFGADVMNLTGGNHNALTIDLTGVSPLQGLHVTLGCGNDNLAGAIPHTPDRGATLAMVGLGLGSVRLLRGRWARQ